MKQIRVAAVTINQTPLDLEQNTVRAILAIKEARHTLGASIICLPELCLTGYGCEDAFHMLSLQADALKMLHAICQHCRSAPSEDAVVVSVGVPVMYRNALFNCVALISNGEVLGFVAKQHLAGDGLHYEPRWFKSWPAGERGYVDFFGKNVPIGDLQFEIDGVRIGFEVCEDAWVADRPGTALARKSVDIILNPSASHFAFGKFDIRKRFVIEGSRAFGVTYVYANLLGNEAGRVIYDGGALIASCGKIVAQGPRFSYQDFNVTVATIDVDATRTIQGRTASFRPSFDETDWVRPTNNLEFRSPRDADVRPNIESWENDVANLKEHEFTRAIALGLFDYLRKSRSKGFVVSLSGGADSAACAGLVYLMALFATQDLGWPAAQTRLGLKSATVVDGVRELLTCVYQPTRNSSQTTLDAAKTLAEALGAVFYVLNVDEVMTNYVTLVEGALGRPLTWEADDMALQNIQARARAPGVWMIANIKNALLLSTSNRSEAAVGYCTMDGDTAGSISPIAGIDKNFLRHWLRWITEDRGDTKTPSVPGLQRVNDQEPTAELRPQSEHQTDEKDLMPYDVLDAIEKAMVRDKKSPSEALRTIVTNFTHTTEQLRLWVERFTRLWCRNQWKRERYAPSFHVDDENLDPRSWCRFPILSSGMEAEIRDLSDTATKLETIKFARSLLTV